MSNAASTCLPPNFFATCGSAFSKRVERESFLDDVPLEQQHLQSFAISSADIDSIEGHIEEVLADFARQREETKKKFARYLQLAREEAQEQSDLVPLTDEAELACKEFANWVADQYFYKKHLKLVATAKLNGGASFTAVHEKSGQRLDISFEPDGYRASIFLTDRKHRVISERLEKDSKSWDRHIQWLFL
jgi:phytoene dehydrogenase-like protein